jgi:hypothetical protein
MKERAMRCANDHGNADVELFCRECGEIMPPLSGVREVRIKWLADPEPSLWPEPCEPAVIGDDRDDAHAGAVLTRADLRRRRRHWPRRLRRRAAAR